MSLKINFSLYETELPTITSSKIFSSNKNEYHDDGLYSQKIFGPVKNYECKCGKLKGKYYEGQRCDSCGVLCASNDLRMKTFAKIKLPDDIWVVFPPLKHILYKMFSKKAVDKIMSFDPHVYEAHDYFIYDLQNKQLVNVYSLIDNDEVDKLVLEAAEKHEFNIDQAEKFKTEYVNKWVSENIDSKRYLIDFKIYSIINLKHLFDYLYENHWDIFEAKDTGDYDIVKHTFICIIPVTPPDTRPVIKIAKNRFSVNDITKSYSEILKNLEHKFMDDIYLQIQDEQEKNIYLANAAKKFQRSVDDIYKFAQENQLGDKESILRNSVLGKTVEFSGRTVVTCGPNVPPYMISIPRNSAKVLFILEILNYLVNTDNEVLDINDIASLMQLITNNIEDAELDIDEELFDKIYNKIRPQLRVMFERPPTLFMYNDSTFILDELFENKFDMIGNANDC